MVIGTSFVVVIIKIITNTIFEKIAPFEKRHTINDETKGQFTKITIMQFINIAIVILLVNFNMKLNTDGEKTLFLGFLPIFNGENTDFDAAWYS